MRRKVLKVVISTFGILAISIGAIAFATACSYKTTDNTSVNNKQQSKKALKRIYVPVDVPKQGSSNDSKSFKPNSDSQNPHSSIKRIYIPVNIPEGHSDSSHSSIKKIYIPVNVPEGSSGTSHSSTKKIYIPVDIPPRSSKQSSTSNTANSPINGTTPIGSKPQINPNSSPTTQQGAPTGQNNQNSGNSSKNTPSIQPEIAWVDPNPQFINLANQKEGVLLPISITNWDLTNPQITYWVSNQTLNISLPIETNSDNSFLINNNLNQLLSTNSYSDLTVVAQGTYNGETIKSPTLKLVVYNLNNVAVSNGITPLYWIPTIYNSANQYCNNPVSFSLLTPYSLKPGQHFVIQKTVTEFWNQNTIYSQNVTLNPVSQTIDARITPGYQSLKLCVVNENNQIVASSNILSINGIQQYYIDVSAPGMNNHLVNVGANGICNINVNTNINQFILNPSNIYYQNSQTNNQWVNLAAQPPKTFNAQIVNNTIEITNFDLNTATNFKVMDADTGTSSQIITLSSFLWTNGCSVNILVDGQLISNGSSYTTTDTAINLSFQPSKPNAAMFEFNVYEQVGSEWIPIKLTDNNYNFVANQFGTYHFKAVANWLNNCVTPGQISYFTINVSQNLPSDETQIYTNLLYHWTQETSNMERVYQTFLKNNPDWFISYLSTWCYGYLLNVNAQNIGNLFSNWKMGVTSNHQIYLYSQIAQKLVVSEWQSNNTLTFNKGDTFIVGLPLYTTSNHYETITSFVNSLGYSQLKINLNIPRNSNQNVPGLAWTVYNNQTKSPVIQNGKSMSPIYFNTTVLPNNFLATFTLNHWSGGLPQYIANLVPLSNKIN